ncbi:MAG: hypothetical protein BMS9Abin29_1620 [Gemmatimonadota bacterium]|nr:MAG: hypothetical protein BMS9Abin29_1620 [Gemmatimonadota bacterium]
MSNALRFLGLWGLWAGGFAVLNVLMAVTTGAKPVSQLFPALAATVAFAAYPAGIGMARGVVGTPTGRWPRLAGFAAGTVTLLVLMYLMVGVVSPALHSGGDQAFGEDADAWSLTLGELNEALAREQARAEAVAAPTVETWLPVNDLYWEREGRFVVPLLALAYGWIGLMLGFWAAWSERPEMRQLHYWGLGFFFMLAQFGAVENGYHFIIENAAGKVDFVAWLALVVPGIMAMGFAGPTLVTFWRGVPVFEEEEGG